MEQEVLRLDQQQPARGPGLLPRVHPLPRHPRQRPHEGDTPARARPEPHHHERAGIPGGSTDSRVEKNLICLDSAHTFLPAAKPTGHRTVRGVVVVVVAAAVVVGG